MTWSAWRRRQWLVDFDRRVERSLREGWLLLPLTTLLVAVFFLSVVYLIYFGGEQPYRLTEFLLPFSPALGRAVDALRMLWLRLQPPLLWSAAVSGQTLLMLGLNYRRAYQRAWYKGCFQRALTVLAMIAFAGFHWSVLFFRLKTFLVVPGWKWYFYEKDISQSNGSLIFGVLLAVALALCAWVLLRPVATRRNLLLLVALGAGNQIGFGFIEGGGFESLRIKYADGVFSGYAQEAARQPDFWQSLTRYEEKYGDDWYLGTKPPGLLATYLLVGRLVDLAAPADTVEGRFLRLTNFLAYTSPVFACLVLIGLHALTRRLRQQPAAAFIPLIYYIVLPSVVLIPLFLDQTLYPLLAVMVLLLTLQLLRQPSVWLAVVCGALLFLCLFVSFSLIPLAALAGLWIALDFLAHPQRGSLRRTAITFLGMLAGFLAMLLLFRLILNYDILLRYQTAMANHRRAKDFVLGGEQLLQAIYLNNTEMLTWSGFSISLLFLLGSARSALNWVRRCPGRFDALTGAFWITYLGMNLLGQTSGEVQRLWLFLLPAAVLFAGIETETLFSGKRAQLAAVLLVVLLQMITVFLTFRYQDFYG